MIVYMIIVINIMLFKFTIKQIYLLHYSVYQIIINIPFDLGIFIDLYWDQYYIMN